MDAQRSQMERSLRSAGMPAALPASSRKTNGRTWTSQSSRKLPPRGEAQPGKVLLAVFRSRHRRAALLRPPQPTAEACWYALCRPQLEEPYAAH